MKPVVLWFTGLPSSGKSTLAQKLVVEFRSRGLAVEHLDGDEVRKVLNETSFTRESRDQHIRRMGFFASRLEAHGVNVVASFISPYRESRDFARKLCARFVEIHLSTPLEECERRDVKGLYARARRQEISGLTGVDDPFEAPLKPELKIDTSLEGIDASLGRILGWIDGNP